MKLGGGQNQFPGVGDSLSLSWTAWQSGYTPVSESLRGPDTDQYGLLWQRHQRRWQSHTRPPGRGRAGTAAEALFPGRQQQPQGPAVSQRQLQDTPSSRTLTLALFLVSRVLWPQADALINPFSVSISQSPFSAAGN